MATKEDMDRFWGIAEKAAPGMLGLGIGAYGALKGGQEANAKVNAAQSGLYQTANQQAQQLLGRSTDPRRAAQERLNAELGLLRDEDAGSEAEMMRKLHARGMLDSATYDTKGGALNPHVYAYQKAIQDRNAKLASQSLDKGEAAVTANINRAGALQGQATGAQNAGIAAQNARGSQVGRNLEFLKGGLGVLKDTGMLNDGMSWLRNKFTGVDSSNIFGGGYNVADYAWEF